MGLCVAPAQVSTWLQGGQKWKLGHAAVALLFSLVLASFSAGAAIVLYQVRRHPENALVSASSVMSLVSLALVAVGSLSYARVASRAVRSSQLHMHGVVILLMLGSMPAYMGEEAALQEGACLYALGSTFLNYIFWGAQKSLFVLLMREKLMALGPPPARCVHAQWWGNMLAVTTLLTAMSGVGVALAALVAYLDGSECREVYRASSIETFDAEVPVAYKAVMLFFALLSGVFATGVCTAGCGMMYSAHHLTQRALAKLVERHVPGEELARVRRQLQQHLIGVCLSIASSLFVMVSTGFVDGLNTIGEEEIENVVGGVLIVIDTAGDIAGIFLLSGMGRLLLEEDRAAGDISGHIRGLLHSAVLTGRAEMVFEGSVGRTPSGLCVASFPGKFLEDWQALTWACEQGDLSSACVFLPSSDPKHRFAKHFVRPNADKCWCHALYGEEMPWGCMWFHEWERNIQEAVNLHLELVVVFFPGEVGKGIVPWEKLGQATLWNGVGLGGSQKAEVAYMRMRGFAVTELDLHSFRALVNTSSTRRALGRGRGT